MCMKELFLSVAAITMMSACMSNKKEGGKIDEMPREIVAWSGNSNVSWETGDFVQLLPTAFDSLELGDEIVVDIKYVGNDPYPMVSIFDGEWDNLSGSGFVCIDSTYSKVSYVVTKNMLESVSFGGLAMTGVGYELNSIRIVKHPVPEDMGNAVWYGSVKMSDDWQTFVNVADKTFYEAEVGDIMRVYFSEYKPMSEFSSHSGKWKSVAEHDTIVCDHYDRVLTEELLDLLRNDGYILNGSGFTVHKFEFIRPEKDK